jgi:tRNA dimethylallyltransferase
MDLKTLIVLAGPTAVGKTALAVEIARHFKTEIINADSRQIYRDMKIGTAVPALVQLTEIRHHFVGSRSIHDVYNASMFEVEVIDLLQALFSKHEVVVMTGGSGLYIDAVCRGIDDLPSISPEIRERLRKEYRETGLAGLQQRLLELDEEYYNKADLNNPKRLLKALEVYEMTGKPYSSFLTGPVKQRDFSVLKIGLDLPRELLHQRINARVDEMMSHGLLDEVRMLYKHRHLNALNTVGYKELFDFLDGNGTLEEAVAKIKSHTRQYARRQLTWFRKDKEIRWFEPEDLKGILDYIYQQIQRDGITGD